jgi:peptidoglycan/LPS O-acetylase OafA/YrhL
LDGLRGIAAFVIAFINHYPVYLAVHPFENIFYWPYHLGWTFVDLFFILSGFIFYQKYSRSVSAHTLSLKKYCILRFSRLYPLHWLTLLTVALFVLLRNFAGLPPYNEQENTIGFFLLNIPLMQYGWFTSNLYSFNGSAWSLSVEIMMYLSFFALTYFARKKKNIFLGSVGFVCAGLLFGVIKQVGFEFIILDSYRGMTGFFTGVIVSGVYDYSERNKKTGRVITILCAALILLSVFFSAAPRFLPFFASVLSYSDRGYWVIVYTFLLFPALVFLSLHVQFLSRLFSLRPLRYLGKISYSVYMIHFPVLLVSATVCECFNLKINYSNSVIFFSYIILVLLASRLSHFHFEIPCQNLIRGKSV